MSDQFGFGDLRGKTVVITGGGGVLCRSFAEAYLGVGARVALLDIRADKAEEAAAELGEDAIGVQVGVKGNTSRTGRSIFLRHSTIRFSPLPTCRAALSAGLAVARVVSREAVNRRRLLPSWPLRVSPTQRAVILTCVK